MSFEGASEAFGPQGGLIRLCSHQVDVVSQQTGWEARWKGHGPGKSGERKYRPGPPGSPGLFLFCSFSGGPFLFVYSLPRE